MVPINNRSVWTRWDFVITLALLGVTMAVFWEVRRHEFITYDDPNYVTRNARVQAGLSWANVAWAFQTTSESNWHPLTWLSHMLDCQWFGLEAGHHHLVNVFFHVLNSLLLFALLRRMTGARWPSALVAALFALHPLHVESVAWVSERKDVLSTFWWMLTMWAYVWYVERPGGWRYLLALAFFALGLMSKPMVVTLPFVLLLLDFWPLGRRRRTDQSLLTSAPTVQKLIVEKIPFLLLTAASCVVTYLAQQRGEAMVATAAVPLAQRLANAAMSYARYIGKMVWPENLAVFYPYVRAWPAWQVACALLMLIGITLLVFGGRRKHPYLAVGWFWYLGTLVPVIGLVQVGAQSLADRYTYVPLIGLFVMLAWGASALLERWRKKGMVFTFAGLAALAGCLALTSLQVAFWKDSVSLFEHALSAKSDTATVRLNLGYALLAKGRTEEALVHLMAGVRRDPQAYWVYSNIGDILLGQGKINEAITNYQRGLQIRPENLELNNNLGVALEKQGNFSEAVRYYSAALQSRPDNVQAQLNLGNALLALGKLDEAICHYAEGVRLSPNLPSAHWSLGEALMRQKRTREALAQYREVLRLEPESVLALNNCAWILATHEDAAVRNGAEAVRLAGRACELGGREQGFLLGTMAAACAEAGRFPEAVAAAQRAVELATAAGQEEIAATNKKLLELYRARQAYREKETPNNVSTNREIPVLRSRTAEGGREIHEK